MTVHLGELSHALGPIEVSVLHASSAIEGTKAHISDVGHNGVS